MQKIFLTILPFFYFIFSCNEHGAASNLSLRDTTITPANASTSLSLDSTTVENFLHQHVNDPVTADKIRSFYNARNYQFAWFNEDGLTEQAEAFWNLHQQYEEDSDSVQSSRQLHEQMDELQDEDSVTLSSGDLKQIELNLTLHFFKYLASAFHNRVSPEEMQWHIPRKKINSRILLDSFLAGEGNALTPLNPSFYKLKDKLILYSAIAKNGGWEKLDVYKKKLRTGMKNKFISQLKKRLISSSDLQGADSSELFTADLAVAVKKLQRSFGLKETGVVDQNLIDELNIPVEDRLKQMLINLERMRWMPKYNETRIVANIPEFRLHVYDNDSERLSMKIVVGKTAHHTVIFSDDLEFIVFSPYWNVPRSIVTNEIVPALEKSSSYLQRNHMEITGQSRGLPVIRQKPGRSNALGKVKFLFPNRYNIYFHDTPAKSLFQNEKRAFSHGCIRLENAFELAKYLLRNKNEWSDKKIKAAMNRSTEEWVKLDKAVPVFIVYFTCWVDDNGLLNFRDDIYGHDRRMAGHLFE